ncbi:MAG: glycine cleavage T C-terminal barrel domain-containing protein [Solirubrobacterales bacterium]
MEAPIAVELDAQYRQLREECGLLDRSARGIFEVRGAEAAEYLQGQLTNDVEALGPGDGCYAALLDRKGHMQSDMRVLRPAGEEFWIDTEALAADAVLRHLETYKIGREVTICDRRGEIALLSLIGPRSIEVAGFAAPPPAACERVEARGIGCLAIATEGGLDLACESASSGSLRGSLLEAGAAEVGEEAAEILRIEAGTPRFGAEMTGATMPAEAGIVERAVSFTKGCYIGQETVARLHYRGRSNRRLAGLSLDSAEPSPGAPITLGEREVGVLGSVCVSPALGPIGLAILRREAEEGDTVRVGIETGARVVGLPFRAPE